MTASRYWCNATELGFVDGLTADEPASDSDSDEDEDEHAVASEHAASDATIVTRTALMTPCCASGTIPGIDSPNSLRFRCPMTRSVLDRVVRTEPLGSAGASGSALERGWLDDGSVVVIKHADARQDWIMQATRDEGRVAALWAAGFFDQVPPGIDHTTLDVRPGPGGAIVAMRDVSTHLFDDTVPSAADRLTVLAAVADMHGALDTFATAPLCRLADYLAFLSPSVCERFAADHEVPRLALEGWSRFPGVVDADVVAIVDTVHRDPTALAAALLERPSTVVHGDLKFANLGGDGEHAVLIDWGTLTSWAPPAVDYAWYLAINTAATGCTHDEIRDEIRGVQGAAFDPIAELLALVGALAQLGWEKALGATSDDPLVAQRERAGLEWWSDAARRAEI